MPLPPMLPLLAHICTLSWTFQPCNFIFSSWSQIAQCPIISITVKACHALFPLTSIFSWAAMLNLKASLKTITTRLKSWQHPLIFPLIVSWTTKLKRWALLTHQRPLPPDFFCAPKLKSWALWAHERPPSPPLPRLCLSNQAQKLSTPGSKTYAAPWFRNFLVQISIFDQMPKPTLSQNIVQKISKFGHLPRRDMKPFWLKPSFHFLPPPFLYRKETSFSLLYNRQ